MPSCRSLINSGSDLGDSDFRSHDRHARHAQPRTSRLPSLAARLRLPSVAYIARRIPRAALLVAAIGGHSEARATAKLYLDDSKYHSHPESDTYRQSPGGSGPLYG
ncbi:hypothetical protein C461_01651 [Halorubrum aidingense JCM 13560]|uniref:Uncharacterized protein n=1 Tax=Halorubrum aidingense JCM 13560 TaxID=1230454 RepID=M0PIQ9_9EURY|nr:hypothetical protein C461_01651 [Halorubrum aidingense JCM 13560]